MEMAWEAAGQMRMMKTEESSEDEDEGAGPAGRSLAATTIGVRCGRAITRLFQPREDHCEHLRERQSSKVDIRARAAAKAADQPVEKRTRMRSHQTALRMLPQERHSPRCLTGQDSLNPRSQGSSLNNIHCSRHHGSAQWQVEDHHVRGHGCAPQCACARWRT